MNRSAPLVDRFGRVHSNLRISVTDRCNIRCFYCMPAEQVRFMPRREILSFEEIERFVRVVGRLGIDRVRLTGGEPLVRQDLHVLVAKLRAVDGIRDIALTTNGLLLEEQAAALKEAGLMRVNISLDTLDPGRFREISRRDGLDRVLAGVKAAMAAGFAKIRLNAVAIRNLTEPDVVPLARFARERGLELRFIEFMPLDADGRWQSDQVLSGAVIRQMIEEQVAPLVPLAVSDRSQPATDYEYADGQGRVGLINPVSEPFCHDCNRLRLTAEGKVRNCLFSTVEWDARAILRGDSRPVSQSDEALAHLVREAVGAKKSGHGIDSPEFLRPERAMYQIGG